MNSSNNMTENSVKIVMKLLKLIEEINATGSNVQKDMFLNKLLEEGYSEKEINDAIKYLVFLLLLAINQEQSQPQISDNPNTTPNSTEVSSCTINKTLKPHITGIRQLHIMESIRLTPDAQAYIKHLLDYGLINSIHFERVIEYLWKYDLREVNQARLELILHITNPESYYEEIPKISSKIGNLSMFLN